jgi:hypothetical protein
MSQDLYSTSGGVHSIIKSGKKGCKHEFIYLDTFKTKEEWSCDNPECKRRERLVFPEDVDGNPLYGVIQLKLPSDSYVRLGNEIKYSFKTNKIGDLMKEIDRDNLNSSELVKIIEMEKMVRGK